MAHARAGWLAGWLAGSIGAREAAVLLLTLALRAPRAPRALLPLQSGAPLELRLRLSEPRLGLGHRRGVALRCRLPHIGVRGLRQRIARALAQAVLDGAVVRLRASVGTVRV